MPSFVQTTNPTSFGFYDADSAFQNEADGMVNWVKRRLGDDVLSVELTKRQVWTCFEEAVTQYSQFVNEYRIANELVSALGLPTGSTDFTNRYPQRTLEYLMRMAEPYATHAAVGGSYDSVLGYISLIDGQQDYDIYSDLKDPTTSNSMYSMLPSGSAGKIRIIEVFHVEPLAAQQHLLNASNITNFLATNFNYESYTNATVFYVLPVYEDVLRRGMLETAFRVRRSNYSYDIIGRNLRIFPIPPLYPPSDAPRKLWVRAYAGELNPLKPTAIGAMYDEYGNVVSGSNPGDQTTWGVSGPSNFPVNNLQYSTITSPGKQWIRQFTLALCKETLGLVRSKFQSIPVPGADVTLNGEQLVSQAREDMQRLRDSLKEFLQTLTTEALAEKEAKIAEFTNQQLKYIPPPNGNAIRIG